MDFTKAIPLVERIIGYTFKDKSLLRQAFTRTSFCNEVNQSGRNDYQSNEVLEFFGDSILSAVIVTFLLKDNVKRYQHGIKTALTEGDFSRIKSALADKSNLSASIFKLGLEKYLIMGKGDKEKNIQCQPSVAEDLFESIVGAVYVDSNTDISSVIGCVSKMLDISLYNSGAAAVSNSKGELQEWCADKKRRLPKPIYQTVSITGPEHEKVYKRACLVGEELVGVGIGKNMKAADAAAAKKALELLKERETKKSDKAESVDYHGLLRSHSSKIGVPSPEFHDLGETEDSDEYSPKFKIECVCGSHRATAVARSKREARTDAARILYEKLTRGEKTEGKKEQSSTAKKSKTGVNESVGSAKPHSSQKASQGKKSKV